MKKDLSKKSKENLNAPIKVVDPGNVTDDEFYKGPRLPELGGPISPSVDFVPSELVKELIPGINWRRSQQDQEGYKRNVD